ncbi:hypothetical protein GCK72_004825 [Caenorhabditis remanei]|uniref:Uncharacterized protein n=1 Tax=Caenorhabditis remanei TaxID=31234 RepID=A0A6A5HDE4_CAERE|nr:hypothetical protein GCK72_004825 [Caenorhabditis remanei]KAF1764874.1 hypothetical protein GCK72_004825 [Caenorhabditis remanei]
MAPSWRNETSNHAQINNHLDQKGYCGTTLNCYWLDKNCCNQDSIDFAKRQSLQWFNNTDNSFRSRLNSTLYSMGLCSAVTTTTATTEDLNCSYLPDACCSVPTLNYLSVMSPNWTRPFSSEWKARLIIHLAERGYCPTLSTTTTALNCFYLRESCCNPRAVMYLNTYVSTWEKITDTVWQTRMQDNITKQGYCPDGATTVSTLDCGWLEEKCCTPEAVELANNASSSWRDITNATRRANFQDSLVAKGLCDNGEC